MTRSRKISGRWPNRTGTTSTPIPSCANSRAIAWASPRFSLPSVTITTRRAESSGKVAWANFIAAARLVASVRRSNSVSSWPRIGRSASRGGTSMLALRPNTINAARSRRESSRWALTDCLTIVDHRLLLRSRDAGRLVQQVDHRHPVVRPQPLHLGQRQRDQQEHTSSAASTRSADAHGPSR